MATQRTGSGRTVLSTRLGKFEAMKTLSGRRALRCDKHQFCDKMTVNTRTVLDIAIIVCGRDKKE